MLSIAQHTELKTRLNAEGIPYSEEEWNNYDHTVKTTDGFIVRPLTVEQLQRFLRIVYEMNQKLDDNVQGIKVHAAAGFSEPNVSRARNLCTGKDQSSFAGLIEEMEICDAYGNVRILRDGELTTYLYELGQKLIQAGFKDFADIRAAHLGLFGIVTKVKLRNLLPKKQMKETIYTFANAEELEIYLATDALEKNPYTTITGMLPYDPNGQSPMWKVAVWEETDEPLTQPAFRPPYDKGPRHVLQEAEIHLGTDILNHIQQHPDVLDPFLKLMQAIEIGTA